VGRLTFKADRESSRPLFARTIIVVIVAFALAFSISLPLSLSLGLCFSVGVSQDERHLAFMTGQAAAFCPNTTLAACNNHWVVATTTVAASAIPGPTPFECAG